MRYNLVMEVVYGKTYSPCGSQAVKRMSEKSQKQGMSFNSIPLVPSFLQLQPAFHTSIAKSYLHFYFINELIH